MRHMLFVEFKVKTMLEKARFNPGLTSDPVYVFWFEANTFYAGASYNFIIPDV